MEYQYQYNLSVNTLSIIQVSTFSVKIRYRHPADKYLSLEKQLFQQLFAKAIHQGHIRQLKKKWPFLSCILEEPGLSRVADAIILFIAFYIGIRYTTRKC